MDKLAGLVVLMAAAIVVGCGQNQTGDGETAPSQAAASAPKAAAKSQGADDKGQSVIADYVLLEGKLVAGSPLVKATEGDAVTIRVSSDLAEELHLHGYDLKLAIKPGVIAELNLIADKAGRFEFELHKAHKALGVLEVQPQ